MQTNKLYQLLNKRIELDKELQSKLQKSILQEAIQGKLVPQDSNDEPASVLLEKIKAEKERLIKEKKIKRDKNESIIFKGDDNSYYQQFDDETVLNITDEMGFTIPDNWAMARLGDLVWNISGLSYKKENLEEKSDKYVRVLRGGNINDGEWNIKDDDVFIADKFVKNELILKEGTFITPAVSSYEQIGKTALIEHNTENIVVGGFVLMLVPYLVDYNLQNYLKYFFQSLLYKTSCQRITNKSGQAFYNLSRTKLMNVCIPIPPSMEQKRITQRIDQLFEHIK